VVTFASRHAVGKSAAKPMRALQRADFDPGEKFSTRFPPAGSKLTPPHQSSEFRWKDYCPMVFRWLLPKPSVHFSPVRLLCNFLFTVAV
jgi:hypothetical protein